MRSLLVRFGLAAVALLGLTVLAGAASPHTGLSPREKQCLEKDIWLRSEPTAKGFYVAACFKGGVAEFITIDPKSQKDVDHVIGTYLCKDNELKLIVASEELCLGKLKWNGDDEFTLTTAAGSHCWKRTQPEKFAKARFNAVR